MRAGLRSSLALIAALNIDVSIATKANATDWREVQTFQQAINQADRRGDFETAANQAGKCVAITRSTSTEPWTAAGNPYCAYYLASALRNGRGIPRDEGRAFVLLKDLAETDHDSDAALALAEAYLDGAGTPRDPVEAGVILWRVEHGAWSTYSDHWGMCDNCDEFWAHDKVVNERIDRELTAEEKKRAAAIGAARFPEIAARVRHRDIQLEATTAILVAMTGSLLWWRRRSRRRSNREPA